MSQAQATPKVVINLPSNPGKRMEPVYERVYNEEQKKFLVKKVKEIDIYDYIQSSASTTDLAQLRAQMLRTGEIPEVNPSLLNGVDPLAAQNIHELYAMVNAARDSFSQLPADIQAIFGDADSYVQHLLAGDAGSVLAQAVTAQASAAASSTTETASTEGE